MKGGTALFNNREVRMYCLHCAHEKDIVLSKIEKTVFQHQTMESSNDLKGWYVGGLRLMVCADTLRRLYLTRSAITEVSSG